MNKYDIDGCADIALTLDRALMDWTKRVGRASAHVLALRCLLGAKQWTIKGWKTRSDVARMNCGNVREVLKAVLTNSGNRLKMR
jgi:hypothetical protein